MIIPITETVIVNGCGEQPMTAADYWFLGSFLFGVLLLAGFTIWRITQW